MTELEQMMTIEDKPNRYANSKVYKLIDDEGYYYYGSTCMPLHKRYHDHKKSSKSLALVFLLEISSLDIFLYR